MTRQSFEKLTKQSIPTNNGDKYLSVGMSVGLAEQNNKTAEWGFVDFNNSDYSGIYTDGLADCAALTIIKREKDGKSIEKAWMVHMHGGVNDTQFPEFPSEFDENYEVIVRYGPNEQLNNSNNINRKLTSHTEALMDKYREKGLTEANIKFFRHPEDASLQINNSFAVHKSGFIGLKHKNLPSCPVYSSQNRVDVTVKVTSSEQKATLRDIRQCKQKGNKNEYKQAVSDNASFLSGYHSMSIKPINKLKNRVAGLDENTSSSMRRLLRDIKNNDNLMPDEKEELTLDIRKCGYAA